MACALLHAPLADVNKDGVMTLMELQAMMTKASLEFSHLEEYSRFLDGWVRSFWCGPKCQGDLSP